MRPATVPAILAALSIAAAPIAAQTPAPGTPAPAAAIDSLALARKYTAWFFAGEMDSVLAHHTA